MLFKISRASCSDSSVRPCDEAYEVKKTTFIEKIGQTYSFSEWFIEINSLDEFIALHRKLGDLIISDTNKILIYDDYVE